MKTQYNRAVSLLAFTAILLTLISGCTEGTWHDRTPIDGGRLSALVASPDDSNVLIAGTPGGGIWRTQDGGANWIQPEGYALADFTILDLQWDKAVSGRLLACTPSDVYASLDMGDHWENLTHSGGYPPAVLYEPYHRPLADPYAFAQLPFGTGQRYILYSKAGQGLMYSQDGINFSQHYPFPGGAENPDNYITCIGVDEASGVVYIGTYGAGITMLERPHLYKSTCAWTASGPCLTWVAANEGLPFRNNALVSAITYGGSAGKMALAISDFSVRPILFITDDGSNWRATSAQPLLPYSSIAPVRQLVSYRPNQLIAGGIVAMVSENWGASWSELTIRQLHADIRAFAHAVYPSGTFVWAVTDGTSASRSSHNIARWNMIPDAPLAGGRPVPVNGLKALQPYYVIAPGTAGRRLFTGTMDNGALVSDNAGIRWTTIGVPSGVGCSDFICMAVAPSNPNRVYSLSCSSDTLEYTDNAVSAPSSDMIRWQKLSVPIYAGFPSDWKNGFIAIHPSNPNRICIAFNNFIAFADDIRTPVWERRTLPGNFQITCVYYDAAGNLYAGSSGNGVYRSTNNGETWTPFGLNTGTPHYITKIMHSSAGGGEGTFFLGTTRGLYRKLPGGTYTLQTADPSYAISDIEVDPSCPSRVYISMGMVGIRLRHRGGVLVSDDNGSTFESLTSSLGIHQAPVSDIHIDPNDSRYLYVASFGLGVWTFERPTTPPCR